MLVVVDANRIFSALMSEGKSFDAFLLNVLVNRFEFVAPEFLFLEVGRHFGELVSKSKLPKDGLAEAFEFLKDETTLVPLAQFVEHKKEAETLSPHSKDVQYFALALSLNCPIWSDEKAFKKQAKVRVFSTTEVLAMLRQF